jgi:uncharacterized membrane protein YedE/YeeE
VSARSGEHLASEIPRATSPPRSRGIGSAFASFLRSPWAAPVFLVPFLLMLAVHRLLGLSDALLAADDPGERPAHGYNLLLGINLNVCAIAALLHLLARSQRVPAWIIARLLIPTVLFLLGFLTL